MEQTPVQKNSKSSYAYQVIVPWWVWVVFSVFVSVASGFGVYYIFQQHPLTSVPSSDMQASPSAALSENATSSATPKLSLDEEIQGLEESTVHLKPEVLDSDFPDLPEIDFDVEI